MSGLASVILMFLPLIFPHVFGDSTTLERAIWFTAFICFVFANYHVWVREHKAIGLREAKTIAEVAEKNAEIERISKPDRCPVVLITEWRLGPIGVSLNTGESVPMNGGFQLQSEGETAHEISLEEFDIEPSVTVASRVVPSVVGHQIGQAFMLAWIKNQQVTDFSKWDLQTALRRASDNRDKKMMWKPSYCCTLRLTYRDHSDRWYRTTQELSYIPVNGKIEFGSIKHEKLGSRKSA